MTHREGFACGACSCINYAFPGSTIEINAPSNDGVCLVNVHQIEICGKQEKVCECAEGECSETFSKT